jgi:hypothetical protein
MAKKGLYYYMNRAKKNGTSNSKENSTISPENYKKAQEGFNKNGGLKNKTMKLKKKGGFPDMNGDKEITQADIFLKKKENGTIAKKGGVKKKKKMYGGTAMKDKKGMGGKMMKYATGGFLEPKTPNLDDL